MFRPQNQRTTAPGRRSSSVHCRLSPGSITTSDVLPWTSAGMAGVSSTYSAQEAGSGVTARSGAGTGAGARAEAGAGAFAAAREGTAAAFAAAGAFAFAFAAFAAVPVPVPPAFFASVSAPLTAPWPSSHCAAPWCFACVASCRGVFPTKFTTLTPAPCCTSACIICTLPKAAAQCITVSPEGEPSVHRMDTWRAAQLGGMRTQVGAEGGLE